MKRRLLQKTMLALPLLLAVALPRQATSKVNKYEVVQDRKTFVASWNPSSAYLGKAAICADGSGYLADNAGRLVYLDKSGKKTNDQSGISGIQTARSLTCDQQGRAVIGVGKSSAIVTLSPKSGGEFAAVSSVVVVPRMTPLEILSLPGSLGLAVLGMGTGQTQPLHVLSLAGRTQSSFGSFPRGVSEEFYTQAGLRGTLMWDVADQSILYVSDNPYRLTEFTAAGQPLGEFTRTEAAFRAISADKLTIQSLPKDHVIRAAMLADGNLFVEIEKFEVTGPMAVKSSGYLEVVDTHLRSESEPIDPGQLGTLVGSDASGNVYFSFTSRQEGTNIIKAHVSTLTIRQ